MAAAPLVEHVGIQDVFLQTIYRLRSDKHISNNAHAILQEVSTEKCTGFFESILYHSDKGVWEIQHLNDIIESKAESILCELYQDCDHDMARRTSVEERNKDDGGFQENGSLTYGEVEYSSFMTILKAIPQGGGGTFYDIGSASGRAVFTARMICDFDRCIGIEVLPRLHNLAVSVKEKYDDKRANLAFDAIEFIQADFMKYDWSDGSVIFCHSTCFSDSLLKSLFVQASQLARGSFLISLKAPTKKLFDITPIFALVDTSIHEMSWGDADVFVYQRT